MTDRLDRSGYELEVEDEFRGPDLDPRLWIPHYLPQWSSREASAARCALGANGLHLRIDAEQAPWAPDVDGNTRVSSIQTALSSGPVGSRVGQHRFRDDLVVRETQRSVSLYAPLYGLFELRASALDDPANMVALWMIGTEDTPEHSAEILILEIFGRDVEPGRARVGMGLRPFGDPSIRDAFAAESVAIDARQPHDYAAAWTPDHVAFYIDERLIRIVRQSPAYPMLFMLDIYEFSDGPDPASPPDRYPKVFAVERFRGYRPTIGPGARPRAFPTGERW